MMKNREAELICKLGRVFILDYCYQTIMRQQLGGLVWDKGRIMYLNNVPLSVSPSGWDPDFIAVQLNHGWGEEEKPTHYFSLLSLPVKKLNISEDRANFGQILKSLKKFIIYEHYSQAGLGNISGYKTRWVVWCWITLYVSFSGLKGCIFSKMLSFPEFTRLLHLFLTCLSLLSH